MAEEVMEEEMLTQKHTKRMANQNLYGLGDYNTAQVRTMALEVEREGLDPKEMYLRRPDASAEPKATIKNMPATTAPFIVPDSFAGDAGAELSTALSIIQLERIGAQGDINLKGAIKIALDRALSSKPEDEHVKELIRYIKLSPAWQL